MKPALLLALFMVTWNEYYLQDHMGEVYTVEIATYTMVFKTKKDANLFAGEKPSVERIGKFPDNFDIWKTGYSGLISDKAFNIQVKEIKK